MKRRVMAVIAAALLGGAVVTTWEINAREGWVAPADALGQLAADFDAHRDEVRVVALLSPT